MTEKCSLINLSLKVPSSSDFIVLEKFHTNWAASKLVYLLLLDFLRLICSLRISSLLAIENLFQEPSAAKQD